MLNHFLYATVYTIFASYNSQQSQLYVFILFNIPFTMHHPQLIVYTMILLFRTFCIRLFILYFTTTKDGNNEDCLIKDSFSHRRLILAVHAVSQL